jgi:hypothetical protein
MAFSSKKATNVLAAVTCPLSLVLVACLLPAIALSKGMKGFDEDNESAPYNLPNLIHTWSGWDEDCRMKKDEEACQNRAQVESMINENGYCRFRGLEWRKCSAPVRRKYLYQTGRLSNFKKATIVVRRATGTNALRWRDTSTGRSIVCRKASELPNVLPHRYLPTCRHS